MGPNSSFSPLSIHWLHSYCVWSYNLNQRILWCGKIECLSPGALSPGTTSDIVSLIQLMTKSDYASKPKQKVISGYLHYDMQYKCSITKLGMLSTGFIISTLITLILISKQIKGKFSIAYINNFCTCINQVTYSNCKFCWSVCPGFGTSR